MNGNPRWEIIKVGWDGDFSNPSDGIKGSWSVRDINSKCIPWLRNEYVSKQIQIWAGTTLSKFKKLIREGGGSVYVEEK